MNKWIPLNVRIPNKGKDIVVLDDGDERYVFRCDCQNIGCLTWRCSMTKSQLLITPTYWKEL